MSTATLTPAADGDWDDFLKFAVLADRLHHTDLPAPDPTLNRRAHRPARSAAERAAIEQSLRGDA